MFEVGFETWCFYFYYQGGAKALEAQQMKAKEEKEKNEKQKALIAMLFKGVVEVKMSEDG